MVQRVYGRKSVVKGTKFSVGGVRKIKLSGRKAARRRRR